MNIFTFADILLLLGIAQGVFLAITLPVIHQKNTKANTVMAIQLAMASLLLVSKMGLYKAEEIWMIQYFILGESLIFIFGPLGFMYVKRLLLHGGENFKFGIVHFIPTILYFSYLVHLWCYPETEFWNLYTSGYFNTPFFLVEGLALSLNLYYWFLCIRLILNFERNQKHQLSFYQSSLLFLKVMVYLISIILLLWVFTFVATSLFGYSNTYINYDMIWVGIPIVIYCIGYFALKQPEIFRVRLSRKEDRMAVKNRLQKEEITQLKNKLEILMKINKVYLNNELTLSNLANELNTTTNNLSWLLNKVYDSTFYDYVNTYRVGEFIERIKNREHKRHTLLSLSMEVGFNSKSTFNKAFKSVVKQTPSLYIKSLNKQSV